MRRSVPWGDALKYFPALDEADQHHDHRDDEEDVDESAQRVGRHKSEGPEDQ